MNSIKIINGNIFRPDCKFHKGEIEISDGLIVNETSKDAEIIDAENLYVIPGLTDIHFHGANGHDFCEGTEAALKKISDYESSVGVMTICPATMTLPEKKLLEIMKAAKKFHENNKNNFAGIYLEGPFISPLKIGAQNPKYISKPDIKMLKNLQDKSGGLIKFCAIAPEVEDAEKFIEEAKNFLTISLAHTNCGYDTAGNAFKTGAKQVTHLFNAMNGINHREPGLIISALENKNVKVELICDGVHIHPAIVRNTIKIFGEERVIFISDSMEATGKPDGEYELGGQKVIKCGNKAMLEDGKTIAGSVTNLFDCMKNAVKNMNVPLETAVKCSAVNPVKALGLEKFSESIETGKYAKLILLDKDLNILRLIS